MAGIYLYDFTKEHGERCIWYNLDLPETIKVRDSLYQESGRVSTVACSCFDPSWPSKIQKRGKMLFVIEGLTMYLTAGQVGHMLKIIHDKLNPVYKLFVWMPLVKKITQKVLVFEKC